MSEQTCGHGLLVEKQPNGQWVHGVLPLGTVERCGNPPCTCRFTRRDTHWNPGCYWHGDNGINVRAFPRAAGGRSE